MPETLHDRVTHALKTHAAPSLGLAAGDVELIEFADGIASVRLSGACAACGMSIPTILTGLEQELRRHVPEVELLEAVP